MKEIKDDTNSWKDIQSSWIGRINIVKMTILPKEIYRFSVIPSKLPKTFFTELGQKNLKICTKTQKTPNSQSNLRKKNRAGGVTLPDFRLYCKTTVIKTVSSWHKNRNIDPWNRIESPETNPHTYGQLIYDKGGKTIWWRKDSLFNKWYWENWTATCKKMKLEHSLTPYTKVNSKWIKDLKVRLDTIKLLEENIGWTFFDINCSNIFFDVSPTVTRNKNKYKQMGPNWTQKLLHSRGNRKPNRKTTHRIGENTCKDDTNKGLISKIFKQLVRLNKNK